MEGLRFGGAYVRREIYVSKSIGLAYSWKEIYRFCFVFFCIRGQFPSKSPRGGLYSEGRFKGGLFCVTSLGGLYLEGLIHGGAYLRNFTVLVPPGQLVHLNKWPLFEVAVSGGSTVFYRAG